MPPSPSVLAGVAQIDQPAKREAKAVQATTVRSAPGLRFKARRRHARSWWRGAPRNLRGSIFMISAFAFFTAMMAGIKAIGPRLPLVEILTIRQLIIVALLLPLFL